MASSVSVHARSRNAAPEKLAIGWFVGLEDFDLLSCRWGTINAFRFSRVFLVVMAIRKGKLDERKDCRK